MSVSRGLTLDRLVDTTIQLMREHGVSNVSVGRLARELGVSTPAIYHHVTNRQALLDLAAERIVATIELAPRSTPWADRLRTLLLDIRRTMRMHPGLYRLIVQGAVAARLRLVELRLSVLAD